jgi:hypothetical protein
MAVNKNLEQTLGGAGVFLPFLIFSMASGMWHLPDPLYLAMSLSQRLKGIDSVEKLIG